MLFPGGQGRLTLTSPDDPLNTGVEIEVRPMGRNIRRISLLSGGERSMVTLAFLFAVFRSRVALLHDGRGRSRPRRREPAAIPEPRRRVPPRGQLLIVTHQKRTMEAADALYGVTMVPGGSPGRQSAGQPTGPGARVIYAIIGVALVVIIVAALVVSRRRRGGARRGARRADAGGARRRAGRRGVARRSPRVVTRVFDRVRQMAGGRRSPEQIDVVEEVLLRSDVGVATTERSSPT